MPLDDATPGTPGVEPGVYLAKLVDLEDFDDFGYGPTKKWHFHLRDAQTKQTVLDSEGSTYIYTALSQRTMSARSKARAWMGALLNRLIQDGESGVALEKEVVGKVAIAVLVLKSDGTDTTISSLSPYTAGQQMPGHVVPADVQAPPTDIDEFTNEPDPQEPSDW